FQCKVHGNYQEEQYIVPADIAVKKVNPPPLPNRKVSGEQYYEQENKQKIHPRRKKQFLSPSDSTRNTDQADQQNDIPPHMNQPVFAVFPDNAGCSGYRYYQPDHVSLR